MQQAGDFNPPPYYHPPQHHHHHQPPPPPTQYYAAPDPSLPSPPPPQPPSYASAPPFSGPNSYSAADYSSSYSQNYPPFPHSSDPLPPTAPPPQPHYPPAPAPSVGPDSYGAYPPPSPPPAQLQYPATTPYYPPYDPHQSAPPQNYSNPPPPPQNYPNPPNLNANSSYYEKSYDNSAKFDYGAGYYDENLSGYGSFGGSRSNAGGGYDYKDDGAYAYQGKSEPYGARGTGSKSSNWSGLFDDYGRAISFPSGTSKKEKEKPSSLKVVRAVPKAESNSDSKGGVQKFRVKLLPESGGQSVMDVLCMVGLDGIRMLDPNTSRTLRIYPLETVTRCDKYDSSTFAFWSKAPVDIEPRCIRLQSNSYTTNTLLDTVTAATVQIEGSGARHAISRRLNASVGRQSSRSIITGLPLHHEQHYGSPSGWSEEHQSQDSRPMYSRGGLPTSDDEDADSASHADRDEESDPRDSHTVYRGQHGRFVSSQASQPTTSSTDTWLVQQPMPGGPEDGTVIPSFGGHVASYIWGGQERNVLRCLSRTELCSELVNWRGRLAQEHLELIDGSGLSHLPGIMFKRLNWPLISAFVERWQPDTNTFHMPFGEITIMLHDVHHILGLRVDGSMVSTTPSTDVIRDACSVTMDMTPDELNEKCDTKTIWQGSGVGSGVLTERIFGTTLDAQRPFSVHYTAYMWLVLGGSLFLDKSDNRTHPSFLHELVIEGIPINEYSWGSATLAYLYRQLGTASRKDADSIAGCLTLLQAWIYEYFPCFRPQQGTLSRELIIPRASAWDVGSDCLNKSMERLLAFRTTLDELTDREVNWLPYGVDPARHVPPTLFIGCIQYRSIIEPYMPDRVLRQLGFVQGIPRSIIRPEKAKRPTNLKMYRVEFPTEMTSVMWTRFVPGSSFSVVLGTHTRLGCRDPTIVPGYMQWLYRFSHPRVSPGGSSAGSSSLPKRTNTDYWMSRSMEIHQRALDEYPNMSRELRAMTEQLIVDWKTMMGL